MQPAPHTAIPAAVAVAVIFSRSPCADPNSTADEAPARRGRLQLLEQRGVGHAEQNQVDGLIQLGQTTARTARRRSGHIADSPSARGPNRVVPQ